MNLSTFAAVIVLALSTSVFSDDKATEVPNPAKVPFPAHWEVTSWDTKAAASFWTAAPVSPKSSSPSPALEAPTLSPTPQPKRFLDRQSEK